MIPGGDPSLRCEGPGSCKGFKWRMDLPFYLGACRLRGSWRTGRAGCNDRLGAANGGRRKSKEERLDSGEEVLPPSPELVATASSESGWRTVPDGGLGSMAARNLQFRSPAGAGGRRAAPPAGYSRTLATAKEEDAIAALIFAVWCVPLELLRGHLLNLLRLRIKLATASLSRSPLPGGLPRRCWTCGTRT